MDALNSLMHGFEVALTFQNIGLALIGCFLGTIIDVGGRLVFHVVLVRTR